MVSSRREVVVAHTDGSYVTPVSDEMVPQLSYIYKVTGSPIIPVACGVLICRANFLQVRTQ